MMYSTHAAQKRSAASAAAARAEKRKIIMGVAMLATAEDQFNGQSNERKKERGREGGRAELISASEEIEIHSDLK